MHDKNKLEKFTSESSYGAMKEKFNEDYHYDDSVSMNLEMNDYI